VGDIDWLAFVILQGNADMLASVNIGGRVGRPKAISLERRRSGRLGAPGLRWGCRLCKAAWGCLDIRSAAGQAGA
jgi:hypothetical protein